MEQRKIPHYATFKFLLSQIQDVAIVKFSRKEKPEVSHGVTVHFVCTNLCFEYERTEAEIRAEKLKYTNNIYFFDQHPELLCRAFLFRSLFKMDDFLIMVREARLCAKN